jgi:hypothetical protein
LVGLPFSDLCRDDRPAERVRVHRDSRAETDLDAGADREVDRRHGDNRRRAVALGMKFDPSIAGSDDERAL